MHLELAQTALDLADKHLKYQIEGAEVSGVLEFADAFAKLVADKAAHIADQHLTRGRSPHGRSVAAAIRAEFGLGEKQA